MPKRVTKETITTTVEEKKIPIKKKVGRKKLETQIVENLVEISGTRNYCCRHCGHWGRSNLQVC